MGVNSLPKTVTKQRRDCHSATEPHKTMIHPSYSEGGAADTTTYIRFIESTQVHIQNGTLNVTPYKHQMKCELSDIDLRAAVTNKCITL